MGLTIDKILVIMVIAMFVIGPDRLPVYAKKLGELVRGAKRMADGAKDRLRDEMGPEFDDVDWRQLDPRQYDPRRIIRDALVEDEREAQAEAKRSRAAATVEPKQIGGLLSAGAAGGAGASGAVSTAAAAGMATGGMATGGSAASALKFDEEAT